MRKSRKISFKKLSIAVVVDGNDEVWYLQMLKRNERDIRIEIEPKIPQRKSIEEQYRQVCDLSKKEFAKVFWIVDLDMVLKEEYEAVRSNTKMIYIIVHKFLV